MKNFIVLSNHHDVELSRLLSHPDNVLWTAKNFNVVLMESVPCHLKDEAALIYLVDLVLTYKFNLLARHETIQRIFQVPSFNPLYRQYQNEFTLEALQFLSETKFPEGLSLAVKMRLIEKKFKILYLFFICFNGIIVNNQAFFEDKDLEFISKVLTNWLSVQFYYQILTAGGSLQGVEPEDYIHSKTDRVYYSYREQKMVQTILTLADQSKNCFFNVGAAHGIPLLYQLSLAGKTSGPMVRTIVDKHYGINQNVQICLGQHTLFGKHITSTMRKDPITMFQSYYIQFQPSADMRFIDFVDE